MAPLEQQLVAGKQSAASLAGRTKAAAAGGLAFSELATLVDCLGDAVFLIDRRSLSVMAVSSGAERMFQIDKSALVGSELTELFVGPATLDGVRQVSCFAGSARRRAQFAASMADCQGTPIPVQLELRRVLGAEGPFAMVVRDRRVTVEDGRQTPQPSQYDPLTGLASRSDWEQRLQAALASTTSRRLPMAVLFLDLDGFKQINDQFGHLAGDTVLRTVAERLLASLRPNDLAARFGGDEFVVLLEEVGSRRKLANIARRVCQAIAGSIRCGSHRLQVTASVGAKLVDAHAAVDVTTSDLIAAADAAMYQAKLKGRRSNSGCWVLCPAD